MRILVVRIGRAGDMVMTTPAIRALLQCYPDATFSLLTSPDGKRILKGFSPMITDTWIWNRSSLFASLEKRGFIKKLATSHFDKIFCFESSPSITALFSNNSAEFYGHRPLPTVTHSAQIYLDIVARACKKFDTPIWTNLPVNPVESTRIDSELENSGIHTNDTIIALHPTYSGYSRFNLRKRSARIHKLWSAKNYAELATLLSRLKLPNGNTPRIIIDLLDNEMQVGREIARHAGDAVHIFNEKPNFERYKALLKRADLLVAPDTGPMHIAAALGTHIVALFSGKDPADCGPFTDSRQYTILRADDTTEPHLGIAAINVNSVYNACLKQLSLTPNVTAKKT